MTYVTDDRAILGGSSLAGYDASGNPLTNKPIFVTYSIETDVKGLLGDNRLNSTPQAFIDSFKALSASQAAAARTAFSLWDAASGVTFLEVPSGLGDIKLATFNFDLGGPFNSKQAAAYGGGGIVYVSATQPGAGIQLFLHEIGHNLGFKHSFEGTYVLDPSIDNYASTVMSYTSGGYAGTVLGTLDKDAVSYLYGLPGSDGTQVAGWSWDAASYTLTQTAFAAGGKITGVGGNNVINGGAGVDTIVISGDTLRNQVTTGAGDDSVTISGTVGTDIISTGDGNDTISLVPQGRFTIDGGTGTDRLTFSPYYSQAVDFSIPAALASGSSIVNVESITLYGSSLGDRYIAGPADTQIYGFGGDDYLEGGAGNDTIYGGDGNDTLRGGLGRDYLSGDAGNDLYVGTAAELNGDTIANFALGDAISFLGIAPGALAYSLTGSTLRYAGGSLTLSGFAGTLQLASGTQGEAELLVRHTLPTIADFNGDAHGDILFRNTDGAVSTWAVTGNGGQVQQSAFNARVDTSWRIVETLDRNGDARSDILFRNDNGALAIWDATGNGSFNQSSYYHGPISTSWRIAGVGDIAGDGKDDLLWQNGDGSISAWTSTGTSFTENSYSHASVGTSWHVEGLGDFNGDGKADILWRNDDGNVATWMANGAGGFVDGGYLARGIPTAWHIDGIGDFNGDGRADILWRNDNGAVSVWRSNGPGFDQDVYNTTVPTSWHVSQVGDLNGDGRADIVWHNDNGAVSTWQSNGTGFDQSIYNGFAPTSWNVAGHDFLM